MRHIRGLFKNDDAIGMMIGGAILYFCPIWQALWAELGTLVGAILSAFGGGF